MSAPGWSLFTAPADQVDATMLRAFIDDQRRANLLTESMTVELKSARTSDNVIKAIAAFANANGGVVLVGVDEAAPSLEDAPGVGVEEVVAVSNQCRDLSPPIQPEIIPVALPGGSNVVLVVRIEAAHATAPVVKSGTVFVRAPGQTVRATRDQIVALVHRATSDPAGEGIVPNPASYLYPSFIDATSGEAYPDFRLRVAGSIVLRSPSAESLMLGTNQRHGLIEAFDGSAFALEPSTVDQTSRPQAVPTTRKSTELKVAIDYPIDGQRATHRTGLDVRRMGPAVLCAVDLEARIATPEEREKVRIGREELATALLEGIEFVAHTMPNVMVELTAGALKIQTAVHVWVDSPQPISDVMELDHVTRPIPQQVGQQWGFEVDPPLDLDATRDYVELELRRLYLDLGIDHEEDIARADIEQASQRMKKTLAIYRASQTQLRSTDID